MRASGRSWCYTLNNYSEDELVRLASIDCVKHVAAKEVGESGTPHVQGYIRFANTIRISWWKNQFPRVHAEVRLGSENQAWDYCTKDGNVFICIGEEREEPKPTNSKEDTTLDVMDMIDSGSSMYSVRQKHPIFYFWNRSRIAEYKKDTEWWKVHDNSDRYEPR